MQDITGYRTYVEEIPEHDCHLDIRDVVEEVLFEGGFPSRSRRCLAFIQRSFLLSRKHPYTNLVFKSTASISEEIIRHRRVAPTTIHPYSEFQSNWEIVLLCYYLIFFSVVPYNISFHSHHAEDFYKGNTEQVVHNYLLLICLIFGYVEILFHFFTGYVTADRLDIVLEKKRIAKHYLKTYFIFDFLSTFPYGFVLLIFKIISEKNNWVEYLAALKIVRIVSMQSYYRQAVRRFNCGYCLQKSICIVVSLILYLHWVTCLLLMSSMTGMEFRLIHDEKHQLEEAKRPLGQQTWYVKAQLWRYYGDTAWRKFLMRSLCYTFGIRAPFQVSQFIDTIPSIIFSLLGIIVTVIAAVQVVIMTRRMEAGSIVFEELETQLQEYLRFKKVPKALNRRIEQYFRFCYERSFYKEGSVFSFISTQLRQDVLLHQSRRLLETVEIFSDLPPVLAVRLMSLMNEQVALDNEVIVRVGAQEDRMYYILTGTVAVYSKRGSELLHLGDGEHFGEASLVYGDEKWKLSVVALETTRMWTLTRAALQLALGPDKEYLERVEQMARWRHGNRSLEANREIRAPMANLVQHLRRIHRSAKIKRRHMDRLESHQRGFEEHDRLPDPRESQPFPRTRRHTLYVPMTGPLRGRSARRPSAPT